MFYIFLKQRQSFSQTKLVEGFAKLDAKLEMKLFNGQVIKKNAHILCIYLYSGEDFFSLNSRMSI